MSKLLSLSGLMCDGWCDTSCSYFDFPDNASFAAPPHDGWRPSNIFRILIVSNILPGSSGQHFKHFDQFTFTQRQWPPIWCDDDDDVVVTTYLT